MSSTFISHNLVRKYVEQCAEQMYGLNNRQLITKTDSTQWTLQK